MHNLTVDIILATLASLIGVPAAVALLIDVGKATGIVTDGNAPRWSAGLNLAALITIAAVLKFYPRVDLPTADAQLLELVKFGALIFQYVIQITVTKAAHIFYTDKLHIDAFSWTQRYKAAIMKLDDAFNRALEVRPDPDAKE